MGVPDAASSVPRWYPWEGADLVSDCLFVFFFSGVAVIPTAVLCTTPLAFLTTYTVMQMSMLMIWRHHLTIPVIP